MELSRLHKTLEDKQKKIDILKTLLTTNSSAPKATPFKNGKKFTLNMEDKNSPTITHINIQKPTSPKTVTNLEPDITPLDKKHCMKLKIQPAEGIPLNNTPYHQRTTRPTRNQLIITSSNKEHKIVEMLGNNATLQNFNYCHFLTPGGGIRQLLRQTENCVKKLTAADYLVIQIGEEDFEENEDYLNLVQQITDTLYPINYTNIIILCPTYICGRPIYNSKIETFNRLMLNNLRFHERHVSYDSNLELSYDMFSVKTGRLNNHGMEKIIYDLGQFISSRTLETRCFKATDKKTKLHHHQKKMTDYVSLQKSTNKVKDVAKQIQTKITQYYVINNYMNTKHDTQTAYQPKNIFFRA
jgi:hypothetical protein